MRWPTYDEDKMLSVDNAWLEEQEQVVTAELADFNAEILRFDDITCEVTPEGFRLLHQPSVPYYGGRLVDGQIWKTQDAVGRWLLLEALDMGVTGYVDVKARYLKVIRVTEQSLEDRIQHFNPYPPTPPAKES